MANLTPQEIQIAIHVLTVAAAEGLADQRPAQELYVYAEARNQLTKRLFTEEAEIALTRAVMYPAAPAPARREASHLRLVRPSDDGPPVT